MMRRNTRRAARRGVACVEFAAMLPFLLILLIGIWDVGRLVNVQQHMINAAREAGRQASTGARTVSQVQDTARNYLAREGMPTANVTVSVVNTTNALRFEPSTANQLDRFQIDVAMPFQDVRWVGLQWFTSGHTLQARSVWLSNRDIPLVINTTIPGG